VARYIAPGRTVYLGYVDNLRTGEWHVVGLMSYGSAQACVKRSPEPKRLRILDPDTHELLPPV
jgi:hypothetical protein